MEFTHFIGVDVSKSTLDLCLMGPDGSTTSCTVGNDQKTIRKFFDKLLGKVAEAGQVLVCVEHTGVYGNLLKHTLWPLGVTLWVEDALQIKQVMKAKRGKNDRLDAHMIMEYAYRFCDRVKPWEPESMELRKLRKLLAHRKRLLTMKKMVAQAEQELPVFEDKEIAKLQAALNRPLLKQYEKSLEQVEKAINDLIKNDAELNRLFSLVTSVDGIGPVTALHLLVYTEGFRRFGDAKKLACHAGVVPFDRQSGTSIRGKAAVSHRANKPLKQILHMAAVASLTIPGELQDYYHRKVGEGKNKMSVINAIRNKLILRVYACVRDERMYQKIPKKLVA